MLLILTWDVPEIRSELSQQFPERPDLSTAAVHMLQFPIVTPHRTCIIFMYGEVSSIVGYIINLVPG